MNTALVALPAVMQLIAVGVPAVDKLIAWVVALRAAAQQSSVWTPELEKAFIDSLIATKTSPAYQPDPVKN